MLKDRRPAKTQLMLLFKNGTSIQVKSPQSLEEVEAVLRSEEASLKIEAYEPQNEVACAYLLVPDRKEIMSYNVFAFVEGPVLELPEKKLVRA